MVGSIEIAITSFLSQNNNPVGLLLLGLSALIEYVFPPFPGDTVTLFGAFLVTRYQWSLPLVFGTVLAGSGIGAMVDFYVGVWVGRRYQQAKFLHNEKARNKIAQVIKAFERHGEMYVVLNRFLPAVRAFFFIAAGMAGLRPGRVLFFALISAAAWNALIIGAGYALGANWERIQAFFRMYSLVAWILISIVAVFFIIRWLVRRRRQASNTLEGK